MNHIHYLREIAAIKKRVLLFASELNHMTVASAKTAKRNENSPSALYGKILNELRALKMSSVIRYKQQYFALLPDKSELATMLALRTLKEKYFLKKINTEIQNNGAQMDFKPVVHSLNTLELYPSDPAQQILRENRVAHNMLADFYIKLIAYLKPNTKLNRLVWILQSMAVLEQKYSRKEQSYRKLKMAS